MAVKSEDSACSAELTGWDETAWEDAGAEDTGWEDAWLAGAGWEEACEETVGAEDAWEETALDEFTDELSSEEISEEIFISLEVVSFDETLEEYSELISLLFEESDDDICSREQEDSKKLIASNKDVIFFIGIPFQWYYILIIQ